jgi:hypothetical protein
MGYRKVPTIYTINDIAGEDGLIVRLKAIKIGKLRKLMAVVDSDEDDIKEEQLDEIFKLLEQGLVSWNLEDEEGQPIPSDMSGIDEQELPFIMKILAAWLENMTGVDDDLGKGSPSGESFPGRPLTMEEL